VLPGGLLERLPTMRGRASGCRYPEARTDPETDAANQSHRSLMARLRLFADLREIAGTGSVDIEGSTVSEVLEHAVGRFGPGFEAGLRAARVWVNGDLADGHTAVGPGDEVALIPPVSGGTALVRSPGGIEAGLVLLVALVLFITDLLSLEWTAVGVVIAGMLWAYDITGVAAQRHLNIATIPVMLAVPGAVLAGYRFGVPGVAAAAVGAALAVLGWGIGSARYRPIESVAAGIVLAVTAAFGSGAMILMRLRAEAVAAYEHELTAFLVVVAVAVAASWLTGRADITYLDPLTGTILGALGAGLLAGALLSEDLWPVVVASAAAAVALIAGRNLGSLTRSGGFFLVGLVPGTLHYLDGMFPAAGVFWLIIRLLT
jgi:molybdopterin converting factor small subunit